MTDAPSPLVTVHPDPPTTGTDRSAKWAAASPFEDWLPTAEEYPELWQNTWKRAAVPAETIERVTGAPGTWHLLVLPADWCIDATVTVPVLARLAAEAPNLSLRLLDRDAHLDLMDEHLTGGTARSIPAVILLDGELRERGWWGPKPAELQAWFKGEGQALESGERYRRVRQWYARDKGRAALEEVVGLLEAVAARAEEADA